MNNNEVSVVETETTGVPAHQCGYYNESLISNGTIYDIVIISANNNRQTIKRDLANRTGGICIYTRNTSNPRMKHEAGVNKDIPCKMRTTTIPYNYLSTGSYYDEKTNLLFATVDVGASLEHPYATRQYNAIVQEAVNIIQDNGTNTSIRFTANDPKNRHSAIYGCFGGHTFRIPCTKVPNNKVATFKTYLGLSGDMMEQSNDDITELMEKGSMVVTAFDKHMTLGLTADEAIKRYNKERDLLTKNINTMVSMRVAEQQSQNSIDQDILIKEYEAKSNELNIVITELKSKIKLNNSDIERLKADIKAKDTLISTWDTMQKANTARMHNDSSIRSDDLKYYEQYHKTTRSEYSARAEATKVWSSVAAVVIGAVVGAVVKVLIDSGKDK